MFKQTEKSTKKSWQKIINLFTALLVVTGTSAQTHFTLAYSGNGQDHMNIYVVSATIGGIRLEAGDEIAAFDGTVCCGLAVLSQPIDISNSATYAAISASKGDAGQSNGYTIGDPITYKFWDSSSKQEYSDISAEYSDFSGNPLPPPTYTIDGSAIVKLSTGSTNQAPVANAGPDQTVNEGSAVTLDGSASTDADGNTLTYHWTAPSGITLSSATVAKPGFTAPEVTTDTPFTFSLVVNDGTVNSASDAVVITVKQINKPPVANAGPDQTVKAKKLYQLDGSKSTDPDNDALTFKWTPPAGITLNSSTEMKPTFTTPDVASSTNYTFALVVNDGKMDSQPDQVVITVVPNQAPIANAGPDQTVLSGQTVTLNGSASSDPDNDPLTYQWTAPQGISLSDPTLASPFFQAPIVSEDTDYAFQLKVNDGEQDSPPDEVVIHIHVNKLPVADAGPNQTVIEGNVVNLNGSQSSDPDNDPLTYLWTAPAGIQLSSATSAKPIFAAPQVAGDLYLPIYLVVSDGTSSSAKSQTIVTVKPNNNAPIFMSPKFYNAFPDQHFEILFEGYDWEQDSIIFSVEKMPSSLKIIPLSPTSAILSGTYTSQNEGDNLLTINLSDGKLNSKQTINIIVLNINISLYVKNPLADVLVNRGAPPQTFDLSSVFADTDSGDVLTYSISGNSNKQVVDASISGSVLTLNFSGTNVGTSVISVTANANGKTAQSTFQVEVTFPTANSSKLNSSSVRIYPNPNDGRVYLNFDQTPEKPVWASIYNSSGQLVKKILLSKKLEDLNLQGNPSGMYFIRLEQTVPKTYKIVLNKASE